MFVRDYYSVTDGVARISTEQASCFAKEIAGDFNPIHDPNARRFCVPGDLLFALVLERYGLSPRMGFRFRGMVGAGTALMLPESSDPVLTISGEDGKVYLEVERDGEPSRDPAVVEAFTRRYTAFSGRNFPEFLEPLMREQGMMFNPARPMVLYDSMAFELQRPAEPGIAMDLESASLEVDGKRGEEWLRFRVSQGDEIIGTGSKKVTLSGLQPFDDTRMQPFIADYTARREHYTR